MSEVDQDAFLDGIALNRRRMILARWAGIAGLFSSVIVAILMALFWAH